MATPKTRLIAELREQNSQIPTLASKLSTLVTVHEESKLARQDRIQTLKEDLRGTRAALAVHVDKVAKLESALERETKSKQGLENDLEEQAEVMQESELAARHLLAQHCQVYQCQTDRHETALSSVQSTLHQQSLHILRLERKLQDREAALHHLFPVLEQVEEERNDLKTELARRQSHQTATVSHYESLTKRYRRDLNSLSSELYQRNQDLIERQEIVHDLSEEVEHFKELSNILTATASSREESLSSELKATQTTLADLEIEQSETKSQLQETAEALKVETAQREDLAQSLAETQSELESTQAESEQRLEDLEIALKAEEESRLKAEEAMEAKGRMTGLLSLSRSAEEGLKNELKDAEEELVQLRETAIKFIELQQIVSELASRNTLAEHDAKQLSDINASLLGHSNVANKIFNIQKIRLELSDLKKKHIHSTTALKSLQSENIELKTELKALKAVDARPMNLQQSMNRITISRQASADGTENISPTIQPQPTVKVLPRFGIRKPLVNRS